MNSVFKPILSVLVASLWCGAVFVLPPCALAQQPSSISSTGSLFELYAKPGNALHIIVYPDTSSFPNGIYPIDSQGKVYLPTIGFVKVALHTDSTFKALLLSRYIDYMTHPVVDVLPMIRLTFEGGFRRPGHYWIEPRASLWEALNSAGGVIREDGIKMVRLTREGVTVNSNLAMQAKSSLSLVEAGFESGDVLMVTTRPKRLAWDVFLHEVVPAMSVPLTIISTGMTTYLLYRNFRYGE
jgi:protein involved in polysaccharide export with SLBB domain